MSKQILFSKEARKKLKIGIDKAANAIKCTLGPRGRIVAIETGYWPHLSKDGISVGRSVQLSDPIENIGAQLIIEVAAKTVSQASDGTTSSAILAQSIITQGLKSTEQKSIFGFALGRKPNAMDIQKGIQKAVDVVVSHIKSMSEPLTGDIERIRQVASISSNGDVEIADMIASAMEQVTSDGVIMVDESRTAESSLSVVEGMQFDRGYASPEFANNQQGTVCELFDPLILITEKRVQALKDIMALIPDPKNSSRSLLIISNDMDQQTMNTLIMNKLGQAQIRVCVIKCPEYGQNRVDILNDIAILTAGKFATEGDKLENLKPEDLGQADKVVITRTTTTIIGGKGAKSGIDARVEAIKLQIAELTSDVEKEVQQKRIARLKYGIAMIYIGATTEMAMKEKRDRVDDALGATKAAIAEGIVPGGGTVYIRALPLLAELKGDNADENIGISIVRRAIEEPLRQICANAGVNADSVVAEVKKGVGDYGYNARSDSFENLKASGVIDPAKVSRVALENAASIGGLFLTTEAVIANEKSN